MTLHDRFLGLNRCRVAQFITAVLCLGLIVSGCGSADDDSGGSGTSEALASIGDGVGIESYRRLAQTTAAMEEAAQELCEAPSDGTTTQAKAAYTDARLALAGTDAIWIGPAVDERSRGTIDPPIVVDDVYDAIETIPAGDLTPKYVSGNVGATKRGLGAIELLLFSSRDPETPAFTDAECRYLEAVSGSVAIEAQTVLDGWETGDDIRAPFTEVLADPQHAAMLTTDLVNSEIFLVRNIADMQLAPSLGFVGDPNNPSVDSIEEGFAGLGTQEVMTQAQAIRDVLVGPKGDEYFAPLLGDDLSADVVSDTAKVVIAAEQISGSLQNAASRDDVEGVTALYEAIVALEATLSTQVADQLGVTIGFSDADGDGAS